MYEAYDKAVAAVEFFLDERDYSYSVRYSHLRCYRELKGHLLNAGDGQGALVSC